MDAEKVVVALVAETDSFDRKVVQSATAFEGSAKRIEGAAKRVESSLTPQIEASRKRTAAHLAEEQRFKALTASILAGSSAQAGAIVRTGGQVSTVSRTMTRDYVDLGNVLVSDRSPFVVPVKQGPQVANAMRLIGTAGSLLGGILGGFVASSVLTAAAALADFILKSDNAEGKIRELVEALKEEAKQNDIARKAKAEFGFTIEGVTAALEDQEIALKKLEDADRTAAHQAAVHAEKLRLQAVAVRENTVATLEAALAQIELNRARNAVAGNDPRITGPLNAENAAIEARVKQLREELPLARAAADLAAKRASETLARAVAERASEDDLARIRRQYDAKVESATKRILADGQKRKLTEAAINREIFKQTEALRAQQRIKEDQAREAKRADHSNDQAGRQINEAQARAIVASIGGTVTSGTRTAKHNEDVGGVPNSFHVKGQALDIAKTAGLTLGKIVKAFEAQGVRLIEKLDEGDHFHIAFGKRGRSGPSAETLEKRAIAAALEAERREQAFTNEKGGLDQQVIDARQALVTSAEEIAKLEVEAIEKSRIQYNEKLASLVEQNKISGGTKGLLATEAAELEKLNNERAKLRTELVQRREGERKFRIQEADAQRKLDFQVGGKQVEAELLQSRAGLATTAKQRHDLEKRLIDLQFDEERLQLQAVIAGAERLRIELDRIKVLRDLSDEERAALQRAQDQSEIAQQRLDSQGERKANAETGNDEANASPLQSFFADIPNTADEINESFEKIAAGGLQSVTDGLTEAILGMRSFGDVGRAVLQQVLAGLIKLGIQQLLLATIGQAIGTATAGVVTGQMAVIGAAAAGPAALVSLASFGANAIPAQAALISTTTLAAALGTPKGFRLGGYTGDGSEGAPAGIVHGREYVFDAPATRRIGVGNLEALRSGAIRPSNAAAVAPRGSAGGGLGPDAIRELGGIVRGAIEAMPAVNLYPTFDPVQAMQAALNTSGGRKVMAEFMNNNPSLMGVQLR